MKIINEKVDLDLGDKFVSTRLVKETLERNFTVRVVEERSNYIKLIIIRWARLYGFPYIWPQASIEVWLNRETDNIIYEFFWPEYWALIIPFALMPLLAPNVLMDFGFYVFAFTFFGMLIFLDTRWVARRVRKAFESL